MSITQDIATLVARADALIDTFDGKKAGIEAAVATALAATPLALRTYFVDQINGNDANNGLTAGAPFQTFGKALTTSGAGRSVIIRLMSDYTWTGPRIYLPVASNVWITSADTVRRKLNLGLHVKHDPAQAGGDLEVGGFYLPAWGVNTLTLSNVDVVFPAKTGTVINESYSSLLGCDFSQGPSLVGLGMTNCSLLRPTGTAGSLIGSNERLISLSITESTYVAADMAGHWVANVAAGTLPKNLGWAATNLASL